MANVTKNDMVLLIGCGIFPSETMVIAQETRAKIVGIDNSVKAVQLARNYIRKEGLSDLITIEYGDGVSYPVQDVDVVFIAINVWPIDSVLQHLASHMKTNARVMCKSIKHDISDVLKKEGLYNVFSVQSVSKNPQTQSYLLVKKNGETP
jgi:precorrin-6B methylase 2